MGICLTSLPPRKQQSYSRASGVYSWHEKYHQKAWLWQGVIEKNWIEATQKEASAGLIVFWVQTESDWRLRRREQESDVQSGSVAELPRAAPHTKTPQVCLGDFGARVTVSESAPPPPAIPPRLFANRSEEKNHLASRWARRRGSNQRTDAETLRAIFSIEWENCYFGICATAWVATVGE